MQQPNTLEELGRIMTISYINTYFMNSTWQEKRIWFTWTNDVLKTCDFYLINKRVLYVCVYVCLCVCVCMFLSVCIIIIINIIFFFLYFTRGRETILEISSGPGIRRSR